MQEKQVLQAGQEDGVHGGVRCSRQSKRRTLFLVLFITLLLYLRLILQLRILLTLPWTLWMPRRKPSEILWPKKMSKLLLVRFKSSLLSQTFLFLDFGWNWANHHGCVRQAGPQVWFIRCTHHPLRATVGSLPR